MKNNEVKNFVKEQMLSGQSKNFIFSQLVSLGVPHQKAANYIVSYLSPECAKKNKYHIILARSLSILVLLFCIYLTVLIYRNPPNLFDAILNLYIIIIPVLFTYGFFKNNVAAYNSFFGLGLIFITKVLDINIDLLTRLWFTSLIFLLIAYIYYVKKQLFPDYPFNAKKTGGNYIFTEDPPQAPKRKYW